MWVVVGGGGDIGISKLLVLGVKVWKGDSMFCLGLVFIIDGCVLYCESVILDFVKFVEVVIMLVLWLL